MTNRIYLCLLIAFLTLTTSAFAKVTFYGDIFGGGGNGKAKAGSDASSPEMTHVFGGITYGLNIAETFVVGGTSDYRSVSQRTASNALTFGNRSGTRINVFSPTLIIDLQKAFVKADYQFIGNYELTNSTATGQKISYQAPKGYRGQLGFYFSKNKDAFLSLYYEALEFGSEQVGTAAAKTLTNKLRLNSYGVIFGLILF